MEHLHDIEGSLTGNNPEDVEFLNSILRELAEIQKQRPRLFKLLEFNVNKKNQYERNRKVKLMFYEGPDEATLELLERKYATWMSHPETFWQHSSEYTVDFHTNPQARIVREYLKAESDSS